MVFNGILALILIATVYTVDCQSFNFMTLNIRYDNPDDGLDNWNYRKDDMIGFISDRNPVIFGIQEGLGHQVEYLDLGLEDYSFFGVGRDDGKNQGEYCAIFYQPGKVRLLKSDTFWLSETPDDISVGWDAALPRICTYGLFQDQRSARKFWVFNTHFDHRGVSARERSASLLVEQIKSINTQPFPVVLMGDFNATVDEKPIETIKSFLMDCLEISEQPLRGPVGTINGFKHTDNSRQIDFIFSSGFKVATIEHVDARTKEGRHLSDHLPVIVNLLLDE